MNVFYFFARGYIINDNFLINEIILISLFLSHGVFFLGRTQRRRGRRSTHRCTRVFHPDGQHERSAMGLAKGFVLLRGDKPSAVAPDAFIPRRSALSAALREI